MRRGRNFDFAIYVEKCGTESSDIFISVLKDIKWFLKRLKNLGCEFSITDDESGRNSWIKIEITYPK